MSVEFLPNRRRLMKWLSLIGMATGAAFGGWQIRGSTDPVTTIALRLKSLMDKDGAASAVGLRAGHLLGGRDSLASLVARLVGSTNPADVDQPISATDADLGAWLIQRIQEDFRTGRVVAVDGWQLSEAEVLACTIASRQLRS